MKKLRCGSRLLDLSVPSVMGIINATPDSFSDGGQFFSGHKLSVGEVLRRAETMVDAGAALIDIGGESTRPGAQPVPLQEELDRVIPLVEAVANELDVIVSVDTSSPEVIVQSAAVGAGLINDVRALQREGAMGVAYATGLPICMMHMQGEPKTMQDNPSYENVLGDVVSFFERRVAQAQLAGFNLEQIILDPGFGFGKSPAHNLALLKHMQGLLRLGCPLLVGLSRKSVIGHVLDRKVDQRLAGSLALALLAAQNGASIIRVHDVPETVDVLKMLAVVGRA